MSLPHVNKQTLCNTSSSLHYKRGSNCAGAANNKGLLGGAPRKRKRKIKELTFNIELNIKYSLVLFSPTRMQQNVCGTYNTLVGPMFSVQVVLYWTLDDSVQDLSSCQVWRG